MGILQEKVLCIVITAVLTFIITYKIMSVLVATGAIEWLVDHLP